jgi:hypothetical protein
MPKYAKNTSVPISRSKTQIEETLLRYGIEEFGMGVSPRGDGIIFKKGERMYKINVPNPNPVDYSTDQKYEQARRQRWRILLLSIKAKLEEIEAGLISFDDQFLAYMALPDGSTVGDFMRLPENIERLAETKMPKLLVS